MQGGCCARGRRDVLGLSGEEGSLKSGGALAPRSGADREVTHADLFEEADGYGRAWL